MLLGVAGMLKLVVPGVAATEWGAAVLGELGAVVRGAAAVFGEQGRTTGVMLSAA